jgi:predicted ATP-dependent protease
MIPRSNVQNLMLKEDVVEAVAEGRFHIWPVSTIDEGIEVLTGIPAGKRGEDGEYPDDTIHGRIDRRLRDLAECMAGFARGSARENNGVDGE